MTELTGNPLDNRYTMIGGTVHHMVTPKNPVPTQNLVCFCTKTETAIHQTKLTLI